MIHARQVGRSSRIGQLSRLLLICSGAGLLCASCRKDADTGEDPKVTTLGSVEVTARLVEIRDRFPDLPMYDYVYVLKYQVLKVHRGKMDSETLYVGQYNPLKPRSRAADGRVKTVGGNLDAFRAGNVHRLALEVPIDDYYMGGIINKYFNEKTGPLYFAVWTNRVTQ